MSDELQDKLLMLTCAIGAIIVICDVIFWRP